MSGLGRDLPCLSAGAASAVARTADTRGSIPDRRLSAKTGHKLMPFQMAESGHHRPVMESRGTASWMPSMVTAPAARKLMRA